MKEQIKNSIEKIKVTRAGKPLIKVYDFLTVAQYKILCVLWKLKGKGKPSKAEAAKVVKNVTFIFKSFERQNMAKRLYRNLQKYYPGVTVIIADDSEKPLELEGNTLKIVQLPFNRGLSYGLNRALEKVETPFTVRIDDDMLLTPYTEFHKQLDFLNLHPEVDLVGVQALSSPFLGKPRDSAGQYFKFDMNYAPKRLIIPHKTRLDESHYVVGKTPNIFLIRTEKYKMLGYDDLIRMIDHHEFFTRAAGNIVSVMDVDAFIFHYHNRFDNHYDIYRGDWKRDFLYIQSKYKRK